MYKRVPTQPVFIDMSSHPKIIRNAYVVLCACVSAMWASMVLPNALYDGMQSTSTWSLTQVALIYTIQIFTIFLTGPVWGIIATKVSGRILLTVGILVSGFLNCMVAASVNSYVGVFLIHIIKGIFLAPCQIITRGMVAKYYKLDERSTKYGQLELAAGIGGLVGVVFGASSFIGGAEGYYDDFPKWGVPFILLGVSYFPLAYCVNKFVVDPDHDIRFVERKFGISNHSALFPGMADGDVNLTRSAVRKLCTNKTWFVISLQGVTGATPWPALGMLLYYFQLMGINDFLAIFISSAVAIGAALGGLIGGKLGDHAYQKSPKYGRIVVSQVSVIVGIPLLAIFFFAIPNQSNRWWLYAIYGIFSGSLISWSAPCNIAMLSDVFDQLTFPFAFGVEQMFEGAIAAWAPTAVAGIATAFGVGELKNFDQKTPEERESDLSGLGSALYTICAVGWGLCAISMCGMYYVYPKDSIALNKKESPTTTNSESSDEDPNVQHVPYVVSGPPAPPPTEVGTETSNTIVANEMFEVSIVTRNSQASTPSSTHYRV
ncbi:major facilitator superfamily transporter protein [Emiliania huxleyi virus 202]|nr:major facilitator superfamily transporter protein [Emiliania huxleyi virus 202]AHA54275.1 Major Facilitator Superfamily protein [Emiliania huxleyi virus 18]AHA55322.1 Major Facilitator Superfamily protein [Emiliania huxleyi virus 156]